ncbi:MAG: glycoside hydrolase family 15 protein [Bacteroidales bacterium]
MEYKIRNMGMIGDRKSGALIDLHGDICWYCPEQFDAPSFFGSLLNGEKGGVWSLQIKDDFRVKRKYLGNSNIIESTFYSEDESLTVTDWMPMNDDFTGICRFFSPTAFGVTNVITPAPGYGREKVRLKKISDNIITVNDKYYLSFSHQTGISNNQILFDIPSGEEAWAILSEGEQGDMRKDKIKGSLVKTREAWDEIASYVSYKGPYQEDVYDSLRAIRQLTHEESGGIIAALTTSLPEVPGGERNYDYRYVWLRDASMIVSALIRAGSKGEDEKRFLGFICSSRENIQDYSTTPFVTIHRKPAPPEQYLDFSGYMNSKPVRLGNNANEQLQLDAGSNILLAAKLIYENYNIRSHWDTVKEITSFLVHNWHKDDYGIWEEDIARQFTSSKVIMAVALEYISEYTTNKEQEKLWQNTAAKIRAFIQKECITSSGAYAVFAGSEEVDITSALFPEWGFCEADTPEMIKTISELEAGFCRNDLAYRNLLLFDERKEGAFLAASFWMAQYWIMRDNYVKSKGYIDAALKYKNDLGLFSEEADPDSETMLGNFPQSFVHASFIGAAIDFNAKFG